MRPQEKGLLSLGRRSVARVRVELQRAAAPAATASGLVSILRSPTQRRHALRWLQSLKKEYLLRTPSPWLTFDAIDFIEARLGPSPTIFEYGSGGSTLFWAKQKAQCTSVEHDAAWFREESRRLVGGRQVDYRLVAPEERAEVASTDPADPKSYASADPAFRRLSFRRYVSQIDEFPDGHFDIVVVDGRARPSCLMHSARKVCVGGMLVLDNTERSYYLDRTRPFLRDYSEHTFSGAIPTLHHWITTSIFVRDGTNPPSNA
jgi:hypothetical protein